MSREFYVTSKATSRLRNDMAADRQQSGGMKNHHIHNTHRDQRKISEKKIHLHAICQAHIFELVLFNFKVGHTYAVMVMVVMVMVALVMRLVIADS